MARSAFSQRPRRPSPLTPLVRVALAGAQGFLARLRLRRAHAQTPSVLLLQRVWRGHVGRRRAAQRRAALRALSSNRFASLAAVHEVVRAAQQAADAQYSPDDPFAGMAAPTVLLRAGLSSLLPTLKRQGVATAADMLRLAEERNGLRFLGREEQALLRRLLKRNTVALAAFAPLRDAARLEALFAEFFPAETDKRAGAFVHAAHDPGTAVVSAARVREFLTM